MANSIPGWLAALFGPVRIYVAGTLLGFRPRSAVNFVNITVEDDDANDRTTITAAGGGTVNLTSEVTGTLPVANGGTGVTALTSLTAAVTTTAQVSAGALVQAGVASSASTGTINNVATASVGTLRYTNATGPTLTGFADGTHGKQIFVIAVGGDITLAHESASSTAANRMILFSASNATVNSGCCMHLVYDGTTQRWRQVL